MNVIAIIVALAAMVVLTYSLQAINRMTPKTHHGVRISFILVAAGSFGELIAIFDGHQPGIAETLFMIGVGVFDFVDRRSVCRQTLPIVEN